MTISQFFVILLARWKVLVGVFLSVVIAAGVVLALLPKTYTATASVLVEIKADPISQIIPGANQGHLATQVDIIGSERVTRRVVRNLKLDQNPGLRQAWREATEGEGEFEGWMAAVLSRRLDIKPSQQSSVIFVSYKSDDPRFSAAIANAYVQAYVDTVVDLRTDPAKSYSSFFEARSKDLRDQIEKAQTKLSEFQRSNGIIAADERLDVEMARMNELAGQLVAVQAISAESGSKQAAAGKSDNTQEVLLNGLISSLKADLARQEATFQQLTSRLGDNHPQVLEAKAMMADARRKIAAETARVTSGVGVTNTINRQREAEIKAAFDAQKTKVLKMRELHDQASVLQRDVDNAQRAYDAVMLRYNQQSLESQTTQSNVGILSRATEPGAPTGPKVLIGMLLAVFGGTLLGVLAALGVETMNRKVRTLEDVTHSLGLPVIGLMPGPDRRRLMGRRMQPMMARRVLGQLPMSATK